MNVNTAKTHASYIFSQAREILTKGISRTCYWPLLAVDGAGKYVPVSDPNATFFTVSGAIYKALMDLNLSGTDNNQIFQDCINVTLRHFPQGYVYNYEPAVCLDLACINKKDSEILSIFENIATSFV